MKIRSLVILVSTVCSLGYSCLAEGKVLYVNWNASGDGSGSSWQNACTSLSAGLVNSSTDDEIWVSAGTYNEAIIMKEGVVLYGGFAGTEIDRNTRNWKDNKTIIDASETSSTDDFIFMQIAVRGANHALLDGFTITGGAGYYGSGVYCNETSPALINCTITSNSSDYNPSGVYLDNGSSATLTNCLITKNKYGGVYCGSHSSPVLTNCLIVGNNDGEGIKCSNASSPKLIHCTIVNNSDGGLFCLNTSPVITNCILWNQGDEIIMSNEKSLPRVLDSCIQGGWNGVGNMKEPPLFVNPASGDYHLQNHSPCIDAGSLTYASSQDLEGNPRPGEDGLVDMGAYESPDAYIPQTTPQNPILYARADAHEGGDGSSWENAFSTIQKALEFSSGNQEVWVAAGTYRENVTLEPTISLYGGFLGVETARDKRDWVTNKTIIDASGMNCSAVMDASGAELNGFTVTGGSSSFSGGGVFCFNSSFTLTNCTITGNQGYNGGGVACYHCSPTITNCKIVKNIATEGNGGGFSCFTFSSSPKLTNCLIAGNTAKYGGGVYCDYYSYPDLTNCTLTGNTANEGGGGYSGNYASLHMLNCIVWGNTPTKIGFYDQTAYANITWSLIEGGYEGEGNIDGDPLFVQSWDGQNADLHLLAGSPCIDAGNPDSAYNDGYLPPGLGTARCDMGAYGGPLNGGWLVKDEPVTVPNWPVY